jgi:hypothetical protein
VPQAILPFLPMITAGLGTLGSALGSRSKTTTAKSTLPPELQALFDKNSSFLSGVRDDPSAGLGPIKSAAMDQVNRNSARLPKIAAAKLAGRGFGSSGKVGDSVYDSEGARLSDLSQVNSNFAKMGSDRQMSAAQIIEQMINSGRGTSQTTPGNVAGNSLTTGMNSLTNISILSTLAKMLGGGGSAPASLPTTTGRNPADSFDLSGVFGVGGGYGG